MMGTRRAFLFACLFALMPFVADAEPTVSANVSATEVTINGQITLIVEISGVNNVNGAPTLSLPNFQTQSAGQQSSYQWVNGQTTSLTRFSYILSPLKTGAIEIPSITLNVDGKTYSTQPITINVRPDSGPVTGNAPVEPNTSRNVQVPAEGLKPVFMTATVDSDKVYVGQQILLKIQFLKRPDVRFGSQARYTEPDLTGFLVEPLKKQEFSTTINGARYEVTEIPYALFPTSDGDFAIGSAQIELAVRSAPDPFDPNGFFQSFFGRSELARLSTRAIPVRVRSLPLNKPSNFSGAVGRFKLSAKIDSAQLEVGKPFNLLLTVEGVGNIKTIKEPFLPELHGFRRYETISNSKVDADGKFLNGKKEFKILLIPQVSGQLVIPSAAFTYFNPAKSDYAVETTPELPLTVKPGTLNESGEGVQIPIEVNGQTTTGVRMMEKNIRFLKPGKVRPMSAPLYRQPFFLILNLIPPLFALVAFLTRRQSLLRVERAAEFRSKGALKAARKQLGKARKMSSSADAIVFYGAIHAAVAGYLADKLGLSVSGLIWDQVDQRLLAKNTDAALRSELRDIFDQADMARFATPSFSDESRDAALKRAEKALERLNEVLA